jgi:hypothetical protein
VAEVAARPPRTLVFGALARPLCEQLGRPAADVEAWQQDADAITRLAVRGLLTDRERHAARCRLLRRIEQESR